MNHPKISVIMPVYNTVNYLADAIKSILNQTFSDFEFIIIDDASTDGSLELIKSYHDSRIVLVKNEVNKGLVFCLNFGVSIAKGEYIARMDSDDISLKNRFFEQNYYLDNHPDVGVCGSYVRFVGEGKGIWRQQIMNDDIKAGLINGSPFSHPVVMMRADIFKINKIRYSDKFRWAEDYFLWYELSQVTNFYNIPKVLLNYRLNREQVSVKYDKSQEKVKQEIRLLCLSKIIDLSYIDLVKLLEGELDFKLALLMVNSISEANTTSGVYKVKSLNRELSYILINTLLKSTERKSTLLLILSPFFKFYSLRIKLSLLIKLVKC